MHCKIIAVGGLLFSVLGVADGVMTTVTPRELTGPLTNPGTGVASFNKGNGTTLSLADYPDTGIEYDRLYWDELEPAEGQYNFQAVDAIFELASQHQPPMNVGLRFMALDEPASGSKIPDWLIQKGIKGEWTPDKKTFVPDLDDPVFIEYSQRLLNAFGLRYDGNSNLAYIDIGLVGSWGEWHNTNFPTITPLIERYTSAQLDKYVEMYFAAFPNSPKIMLINGGDTLASAVKQGAGWRADCWGDWHNFSTTWSHMQDDYPQRLQNAEALYPNFSSAWQRAPVSLEICGHMSEWQSVQHYTRAQVQVAFDWALAQHASTINLKSRSVPTEYRDIVDNALTKLGYRFRLASLTHESELAQGQSLTLNQQWFNDGVAPIYLKYDVAYRVVNDANTVMSMGKMADDIRTWLPGQHTFVYQLAMPEALPAGQYNIEMAMLDAKGVSRINLANEGKQADGWYRISTVTVR
ncbi:DUF4832 domain-containing protein [Pectobacterium polaris]|uniref:DUF4832 domain-containing protein n=1 Tax=Pectobacterium polaris TaxID=2042057 RepID=UPI000ACB1745|nr:DUF4832 domain-containing protein [Pectobacterium polaris]ASY76162.1 DUF4832 domain-containing protein [Pectobacterium polaris]MCL6360525.1 DUF4832 domain-containing protein [Pectobacterium polaris]